MDNDEATSDQEQPQEQEPAAGEGESLQLVHVVAGADTLRSIAEYYYPDRVEDGIAALVEANGPRGVYINPDHLEAGRGLIVPVLA